MTDRDDGYRFKFVQHRYDKQNCDMVDELGILPTILSEENKELKAFKEKVFEWIDGEMDSVKESCNVLMTSDEAEAIMDTLTELKNELSGDLE